MQNNPGKDMELELVLSYPAYFTIPERWEKVMLNDGIYFHGSF